MKRESPIAVEAAFSVAYEDEDVLVVDKAAPLLMHPTGGNEEPTLWHGVRELLAYELATGGQVSLINRLDRETSGLVLIAKNSRAAHELGCAMQQRLVHKRYMAVVQGMPPWESACCAEPILRMETVAPTRVHVRQACHPAGKACSTAFRVLKRVQSRGAGLPSMSLLECIPYTGRMHQIRVHAAYVGYPLVGDKIYGGDETCYLRFMEAGWTHDLARELRLPRHALHAYRLEFSLGGRQIEVQAPLPADMAALLGDAPFADA